MENLLKTPLHDCHVALGARMVPFAGWEMPVQYTEGILKEHLHTRTAVSVFDISHMGEFTIKGAGVASDLDRILARPVLDQKIGSCRYNFLLSDQGTVIDDLLIYRMGEDDFFVVVNAATKDCDKTRITDQMTDSTLFDDISDCTAKIDLQGPLSADVLDKIGIDKAALPPYYHWMKTKLDAIDCLVSRTGYTGELGFEIYVNVDHAETVWSRLLDVADVKPAGLGARDTLRLEMGYALYGHELDLQTTPVDAGYGKMLKLDSDRPFTGKGPLLESPSHKQLLGLQLEGRQAARENCPVLLNDKQVGMVTSGAFSPSLSCAVALAYINRDTGLNEGDVVKLDTGRKCLDAAITGLPFYKNGTARKQL